MPRVWRYFFLYNGNGDWAHHEHRVLLESNGSCANIYKSSDEYPSEDDIEYCVKLGTYIEEGSTVDITWACQVKCQVKSFGGGSAWCLDTQGGQGENCKDVFVVNRTGMSINLDRQIQGSNFRDISERCGLSDDEAGNLHSCLASLPESDQLFLLLEGEGFPHVFPEKTKRKEKGSAGP